MQRMPKQIILNKSISFIIIITIRENRRSNTPLAYG